MRKFLVVLLLGFAGLLSGCSSLNQAMGGNSEKDALIQASWGFAAEGIAIKVDASPALNFYDAQPHPLVLAVVQLTESTPFYQLLADENQLTKILQGDKPPAAFLSIRRYAILPGQQALIRLDRSQNTRLIGVIPAYFGENIAKSARLFNVPLTVDKSGLIVSEYKAEAAVSELTLKLGEDALLSGSIAALSPEVPQQGETGPPDETGAIQLSD
ncbi:type VI secretion system lipoprotein TssJ [Chitinibacter sp. S2-10]|uniref:type VI secretion system lipoprotein TssJ n=1 Tax=Chitinibacter sp. S2-10 TaxID=3373597 RepID=UPI003977983A